MIWKNPDIDHVLGLIKDQSIYQFSATDGCMCGGFELKEIHVDISCGKGLPRVVRVWSNSGDYGYEEEQEVLFKDIEEEVRRQVMEADGRGEMKLIYHKWSQEKG